MARNRHTGDGEDPQASRNTKPPGEHHRTTDDGCDASDAANKDSVPDLDTLVRTISECRQLASSARRQIEILVDRNIQLQNELAELAQKESQARHFAYHDNLTGLPNRSLLQDRFHQAMFQAERNHKPLALVMLDLNEFKLVNDRLGHASGDKLLQAVADRLTKGIRGADTACRYGGDEFVVMLPEINSPGSAAILAIEIGQRLGEPYFIESHQIHMAVSVGVAVYPDDGQTFDELMKQADIEMYRAKGNRHPTSIAEQPRKEYLPGPEQFSQSSPLTSYHYGRELFSQEERAQLGAQQDKCQNM